MFMTPLTEFEYYCEKAEFQDPVSHRMHVENYKKGIRDSIAFEMMARPSQLMASGLT